MMKCERLLFLYLQTALQVQMVSRASSEHIVGTLSHMILLLQFVTSSLMASFPEDTLHLS